MKDDHKNMLLGFLAAKSKQSGQPSNWQTAWSQLNFLQKLWLVPFYFSLWALLAASIIFLVGTISFLLFSGEASTVVPTFWIFTGGREIAIVIVFIIGAQILDNQEFIASDFNFDGMIDVLDVVLMLEFILS